MPRRYRSGGRSGRRRSYGGSRRRSRGGARSTVFRSSSRKRTAGWHWLLTGVLVGTVVTGMLYLNEHPLDQWRSASAAKDSTHEKIALAQAKKPKPKYEFYRMLSKPSHDRHETDISQSVDQILKKEKSPPPRRFIGKAEQKSVPSVALKAQYHLQLASFPSQQGAKKLQQQLRQRGLQSTIVAAQINGKTWYRVMSPGIATEGKALAVQSNLKKQGIAARLIRQVV